MVGRKGGKASRRRGAAAAASERKEVEETAGTDDRIAAEAAGAADDVPAVTAPRQDPATLLLVAARHMNPDTEMQHVLGHRGGAAAAAGAGEGGGGAAGDRRNREQAAQLMARMRGAAGGVRASARSRQYVLVTPQPFHAAPPSKAAGGLSMVRDAGAGAAAAAGASHSSASGLSTDGGVDTFALEYSDEYRHADLLFQQCAASGDPQALMQMLQLYPYHIGGLLALAEYQRTTRQHEAAAEALRAAAFALESVWHPAFKPWERPCRLARPLSPEGRIFTGVLFAMMQQAGRAAAPRAALEIARLLLQLSRRDPAGCDAAAAGSAEGRGPAGADPGFVSSLRSRPGDAAFQRSASRALYDDHSRVLLCLDFYALRSQQFEWLVQLTGAGNDRWAADTQSRSALNQSAAGRGQAAGVASSGAAVQPQQPRACPNFTLRGSRVPVCLLPNLAFSRALALFKLECKRPQPQRGVEAASAASTCVDSSGAAGVGALASEQEIAALYTDPSVCLAGVGGVADGAMQLQAPPQRVSAATCELVRALLLFPHALGPLLKRLGATEATVGVELTGAAGKVAIGKAAGAAEPTHPHVLLTQTAGSPATVAAAAGSGKAGVRAPAAVANGSGGALAVVGVPPAATARTYAWRQVLGHPLFRDAAAELQAAEEEGGDSPPSPFGCTPQLAKLVQAFLVRQSELWRQPDVLAWLFVAACHATFAHEASRQVFKRHPRAPAASPAAASSSVPAAAPATPTNTEAAPPATGSEPPAADDPPEGASPASLAARAAHWGAVCGVPVAHCFASHEYAAAVANTAAITRGQVFLRGPPAFNAAAAVVPLGPVASAGSVSTDKAARAQAAEAAQVWSALAHYAAVPLHDLSDEVATFALDEIEDAGAGAAGGDALHAGFAGGIAAVGAAQAGLWAILQQRFPVIFGPRIDLERNPLLVALQSVLPWKAATLASERRFRAAANAVEARVAGEFEIG